MERWLAKLLAALIILTCNSLAGLLPVKVSGWFTSKGDRGLHYLSLANCFGGGVFFGAYLMHMAPEVRLLMEEVYLDPKSIIYPLPELMTAVGFFLVLFVDSFVNMLVSKRKKEEEEIQSCSVIYNNTAMGAVPPGSAFGETTEIDSGKGQNADVLGGKQPQLPLKQLPENTQVLTEIKEEDELLAGPFIILIGLSFHFLFEGITLGLQETTGGVWVLVIAILSHELVISFSFGMRIVRIFPTKKVIVIIIVYSSAIPIGVGIGTIIFETSGGNEEIDIMSAFMLALSAGIFIYVTFLEILREELTHGTHISKVWFMIQITLQHNCFIWYLSI